MNRRNATTVALLAAVVCGMVGLSFASVPLYRLFCQATGFGGTTQRAIAAPGAVGDTLVTVRFDATTAPELFSGPVDRSAPDEDGSPKPSSHCGKPTRLRSRSRTREPTGSMR